MADLILIVGLIGTFVYWNVKFRREVKKDGSRSKTYG